MFYLLAWFYGLTLAGAAEPMFIGPFDSMQECQEARADEVRRGLEGADTCFWGYKIHGFVSVEGRTLTATLAPSVAARP